MKPEMSTKDGNENVEYLLSKFLDGQLDRREEAELHRRLNEDGKLREELRRYTVLNERLGAIGKIDEPGRTDYDAQRAGIIAAIERKVLLEGPPRRRVALRATFAVLGTAAVVLIIASVAFVIFRPAGPGGENEVAGVTVVMLPVAPPAPHPVLPIVELKRLDERDPAMALLEPPPSSAFPPGTLLVSIGGRREISPPVFPAELFEVE